MVLSAFVSGRRSRGGSARVARLVRAGVRAGQERVRHTGRIELRGRRGLGHQLHRGVRVAVRAGCRQARQQSDTALGRRWRGKCILIVYDRRPLVTTHRHQGHSNNNNNNKN